MTTPTPTDPRVETLMKVFNDHVRTLHILRQQGLSTTKWMREVKETHAATREAIAKVLA